MHWQQPQHHNNIKIIYEYFFLACFTRNWLVLIRSLGTQYFSFLASPLYLYSFHFLTSLFVRSIMISFLSLLCLYFVPILHAVDQFNSIFMVKLQHNFLESVQIYRSAYHLTSPARLIVELKNGEKIFEIRKSFRNPKLS